MATESIKDSPHAAEERKTQDCSDEVGRSKPEVELEKQNEQLTTHCLIEDEEQLKRMIQDEAMRLPDCGIAVSGISGRFPKSDTVNEFEENLREGIDMVNDQDETRFSCGLWGLPPRAGRLKDLSKFDANFFGFNHEEANYIDFQLRILYEIVYESILDAGVNPASLRGKSNTGVFFGLYCDEFENAMADDPQFKTNGYYAQHAVKIAQYFDLRGITASFDAACASGFVGLHNAVSAINEGLIDQAIVCSCNVPIHPTGSFIFLQMQMLSPTGYSRFLDSRADGYVKSEACVSFLLQRKDLARRNYCSIMASMTSVDGYKSEGITFPSDKSQEDLIRKTKQLAGISTNHIEYFEAHGTGTPAGDPQEARAVASVYFPAQSTDCDQTATGSGSSSHESEEQDKRLIGPLLVGSVKTNMGHSEAASGLCALTKVALMLENEVIYGGLHYEQPNLNIESLKDGRVKFVENLTPLRAKIIPLSCYGFGGSNVHVIVRSSDRQAICQHVDGITERHPRLVVMFGRTESALNEFFDSMLEKSDRNTNRCLSDDYLALINSLNEGPEIDRLMEYRGFLVVNRSNRNVLVKSISKCQLKPVDLEEGMELDAGRQRHLQECKQRSVNLILPGVGCQWPGMAAGLVGYTPFWCTIEHLHSILKPHGLDLIDLLTNESQDCSQWSLTETFVAIVAYQVALIDMLKNQLKINNIGKIIGHSLGEVSCAFAVGKLTSGETILVAYQMGKTLDDNLADISGHMVALSGVSGRKVEHYLASEDIRKKYPSVDICCYNAPTSVTISGSIEDIDGICKDISQTFNDEWLVSRMDVEAALHNPHTMSDEIRSKLTGEISKILKHKQQDEHNEKNIVFGRTEWAPSFETRAPLASAEYFADCLCEKVDFFKVTSQKLVADSIVFELGPSGIFESAIKQLNISNELHYAKFQRRGVAKEQQVVRLLESLGELYQVGATFNLNNFYHASPTSNHASQYQQHQQETLFPVRRQTPSLSSIFRWDHRQSLFVPRYPIQFSKSSAKCEFPFDVVEDRDKYLLGHCVEGRVLFPATGYLYLIWRVFSFTKRKIYDAVFHDLEQELVPIEFHQVRLMRAVILGQRVAQIYIHYEEATGRFEIKEGGSVVVEGYARSPEENSDGLLYDSVRDLIREENLELELSADDVYKQFRVSGYDYGESFRNIQKSSFDGRYCQVKHNGYFVSLTDSILQSIFLAISQYAPSGGLFLPTRFEYVRFQPKIILDKIHASKQVFDLGDGALDTRSKREVMTKIMQREAAIAKGEPLPVDDSETKSADTGEVKSEEEKPSCIFDVYCDPITGVIITDGIEMRGIKATPAPRRVDNNEVLMESYQFVCDFEDPIEDEPLTKFKSVTREYVQVCDSMSMSLLDRLTLKSPLTNGLTNGSNGIIHHSSTYKPLAIQQVESYKKMHLKCLYDSDAKNLAEIAQEHEQKEAGNETLQGENEGEVYDISKNGQRSLMSVLDQLLIKKFNLKTIRMCIQENRLHLMQDLIQSSFVSERVIRPLMETILENNCTKKLKLRMMEVNVDDGLLRNDLCQILTSIEPSLNLDYSLAHPDIERIQANKLIATSGPQTKTHTLKDLHSLFSDKQLNNFDLIVYKDISCYSLPQQVVEQNGLSPIMSTLNGAVRQGGYVLMIMRQRLTLAERTLLALSEPELVGLTRKHLTEFNSSKIMDKIEKINDVLASRCKVMVREAEKNRMLYLSRKSDANGCTLLLFKRTSGQLEGNNSNSARQATAADCKETGSQQTVSHEIIERVLIRVQHNDNKSIGRWLEELKSHFKKPEEEKKADDQEQISAEPESEKRKEAEVETQVWLCAVATKDNPINGLIGMMQALRKELGSSRLRCYYDLSSFKNRSEPIDETDIEKCAKFQEALGRDCIWNCIDSQGNFGAYRHFTINNYLSYQECACNEEERSSAQLATMDDMHHQKPQVVGAYVNNATRGDLSSFTWFEAPFKYLSQEDQQSLVRVAYSALNFRDIMLATGRLPLDAIPIKLAMCDCLLGLEFSGFDAANRRVMGMVFGRGIATHVICPEKSAIKIEVPPGIDLKEAATIPVVYATAIMALLYRGKMQRGESILIHAGSGGVGQAAIRLAAHFGVEVYTTVGTDEKRNFLLDEFGHCLDNDHIFSSRDCNFEQQILRATKGRGVDLVLNSLADDKLQASINCLADGGRFLEIGKYDMSVDSRLELIKLDHNKTFHGILLDKLFDTDDVGPAFAHQLKCVLETMRDGLAKGYVKPIKYTMFKRHQIEKAFRYMATGKHMGKILIEIDSKLEALDKQQVSPLSGVRINCIPRFQVAPQKSYIVTGGLGGFGMELSKWLVAQGARHLVLTSRHGLKTGYQKATLRRLESNDGVRFLVVNSETADTTTRAGVERLVALASEMSPSKQIGGVFHLAMVLKDTLLENMSAEDFELVCKPKIDTCKHLNDITMNLNGDKRLDYFVAFSSVTSGKGNAGQANYAYANSYLERVCEMRRQRGQHGLAIQWGAIGDVGVAFENLGGNNVVIGGTIPQRMPSCLATLGKLLSSPFTTCLSVLPVDRSSDGAGEKGDLVSAIMHVLGIKDSSKVSEQATLGDLGLDSLMAVEIRQYIEREYDKTLNIQEIRSLTIAKIREISEMERPAKQAAGNDK